MQHRVTTPRSSGAWWRQKGDRKGTWHFCALGVASSACGRFTRQGVTIYVAIGSAKSPPPENVCGHCVARLSMVLTDPVKVAEEAAKPQLAWPDETATRGSGRKRRRRM